MRKLFENRSFEGAQRLNPLDTVFLYVILGHVLVLSFWDLVLIFQPSAIAHPIQFLNLFVEGFQEQHWDVGWSTFRWKSPRGVAVGHQNSWEANSNE